MISAGGDPVAWRVVETHDYMRAGTWKECAALCGAKPDAIDEHIFVMAFGATAAETMAMYDRRCIAGAQSSGWFHFGNLDTRGGFLYIDSIGARFSGGQVEAIQAEWKRIKNDPCMRLVVVQFTCGDIKMCSVKSQ